jgi:recombination protein RecA
VVIFINQIRKEVGVIRKPDYDGRQRAKFTASSGISVASARSKTATRAVGGRTRSKSLRTRGSAVQGGSRYTLWDGNIRDGEIVDLGSEMGIVEKSGAWYSFGGERIGQGREAAKQFLKEHPETAEQIMVKVMEKVGLKRPEPEAPSAEKKEKSKGR